MANANLFQQYLQPARSVVDYENDYAKADALRNQNALQSLSLQQAAAVNGQKNALRQAVQGGLDLSSDAGQSQALTIAPDVAPGLIKTVQDSVTSRAQAQKDLGAAEASRATAGKTTQDTQIAAHNQHLQALATVNTPEDALQWLAAGVANKTISSQQFQQGVTNLQSAAADSTGQAFNQWKQANMRGGMAIQQQMEQTAPKPTEVRLGNVVKTIDTNPYSSSFGKEVVAQQAIGVSPDTVANNATSRANNRDNIAKDLAIAGVDADGNPTGNMGAMVDMLGNYQLDPKQALQRMTGPQRANVVAQVQAKYPGWDETTYDAKKGAAQKFTYGDQGNALRSVAVANNHLDQLNELVDAMGNGNTPVINKVANYFATQTGNPNVTNFDAIKNIVGQEVVKAIVAGGGSAGERDEAAKSFSDAASPAQLKGAINHYRAVMAAQQSGLLSQRRAAGLSDSTLPDYSQPAQQPANAPAPSGWKYLGPAPAGVK